jgi:ATP-dependent RNA helicase RhlE
LKFEDFKLASPLLKALTAQQYTQPTPIQQQVIPFILQQRDLLACAQTGTGKTAAFALPILQLLYNERKAGILSQEIKALILAPTRELAIQIENNFKKYGAHMDLKCVAVYGGVSQYQQVKQLEHGTDILVATPGRLLDLIAQRHISLEHIRIAVLDEADRMLDMGFVKDVKRIFASLPVKRQTLFFSATMPPAIIHLSQSMLNNPVRIEITPVSTTAETVEQAIYFVEKSNKRPLLIHLLKNGDIDFVLVFTETKFGADKLCHALLKENIKAQAIHGNKSQAERQRALANFKNKAINVLIATDIASRGIDIDSLPHVINFEMPHVPETYVHRIGRTGRGGASGKAISFCSREEKIQLQDIHRLIAKPIPVIRNHLFEMESTVIVTPPATVTRRHRSTGKRGKIFRQQ